MSLLTRRDFLKLSQSALLWLSGLLGTAGLLRFLSYQPDPPPPTRFEAGLASAYPLDSQTVLPQIPALLIHTQSGFQAVSLICTHLGCTLEHKSSTRLVCPCHGSQFDSLGAVLNGPAAAALEHLQVEVTADGKVVVSRQ